jgi:hypothetical protein
MNFKFLAVLILFIFNVSATVIADSSHIDLPATQSASVDHSSHQDHSDHTDNNEQHCADHDCCHQGHVHVYLLTLESICVGTEFYVALGFPIYIQISNTAFLEVIKPPLV